MHTGRILVILGFLGGVFFTNAVIAFATNRWGIGLFATCGAIVLSWIATAASRVFDTAQESWHNATQKRVD